MVLVHIDDDIHQYQESKEKENNDKYILQEQELYSWNRTYEALILTTWYMNDEDS